MSGESLNVSFDNTSIEPNAAENFTEEIQDESTDELDSEEEFDEDIEATEEESEESEELTKEEKAEIKRLKKLQLKFNGREYEEELPFEIEDNPEYVDWMKKQLQLAKLGQTKSQEYSQLETEIQQFVEELRKNPRKALANPNLGVDLKALAAEILEEEINESQKTPEQKEKEALERKLRELEEERERERAELQKKEYERLVEQKYEQFDLQMSKALETSDLPRSPYVVKKMADYMMLAVKNGVRIDASDIVPIVRDEIQNDIKDMFGVMPDEVLDQLLGKDTYDRLRKHRLSRAKKKKNPAVTKGKAQDVGTKTQKKEEKEPIDFKSFFGSGI